MCRITASSPRAGYSVKFQNKMLTIFELKATQSMCENVMKLEPQIAASGYMATGSIVSGLVLNVKEQGVESATVV